MACRLFDDMLAAGCYPNIVTYNILLDCLEKYGRTAEAFKLYDTLRQQGLTPDSITYAVLERLESGSHVTVRVRKPSHVTGWVVSPLSLLSLLNMNESASLYRLRLFGLRFKAPSLKISNDRQNSFSLNYEKLFTTGLESKRKGINVVTPNTPLSRKLELLDAYEDEYDGAIIDAECLPASANAFAAILQSSLSYWKQSFFVNAPQSEEIFSGAIREVKEETGIETAFLEVVAFRHAHNVTFEKSDLFFICMLKPLSADINIDESEIEAAMWMPLDQLIDQPFHREDSMTKNMTDICVARYENRYRGFNPHRIMSKFDDRLATLYYGYLEMPADNGVLNEPEDITAL
ncbi:hypothetical protein J5N97_025813 [Dioscorea zingiberensis]|uniref:Nudix hydrolase domain-containing protein n=1 Tax=Dioscorea zingiberensis TaxID=325984 RepID=A0A9D5C1G0_9LILI|nr:hypothetical protein J5N97_025813 [Dioscorea zingiberensis]